MEYATSKAEHLLIFWYQIIATNTSHLSKEECIGHLEDINEEKKSQPHENSDAYATSSVTTNRMMSEQVEYRSHLNHLTTNSSQTSKPSLKHF